MKTSFFTKIAGIAFTTSVIAGCSAIKHTTKETPHYDSTDVHFSEQSKLFFAANAAISVPKEASFEQYNPYIKTTDNSLFRTLFNSKLMSFGNSASKMVGGGLLVKDMLALDYVPSWRANQLIIAIPFSGDLEGDANRLHEKKVALIKAAYKANGTPVSYDHPITASSFSQLSPHYLVPTGIPYCSDKKPTDFDKVSFSASGGYYDEVCATAVLKSGDVLVGNDDIKLLPQGDLMYSSTWLPDNFPIEYLKSDNPYTYLYVAPVELHVSNVYEHLSENQLLKAYESGRISLNPYMKDLKTGEIMYFNERLKAYQENSISLVDDNLAAKSM
ncbi:hypothetical protein [Vibrio nitrifigilis]|uniref:Lipoprotein n=1 Tax=Vibrio nitrifigilis TaxID=2789781 RepID=A0ABS0GD23_9VIBR|nr:hypothetical protein [Vibrio nitrifigilis]MBF9000317.1 hypothetical protein [Vibrio nitrifigilis]